MSLHPFDVYPAIDLLDGQSVRLLQGRRDSAHVVHGDPVSQILGYAQAGARRVHIVNLNAAFGDPQDLDGAARSQAVLESLVGIVSTQRLGLTLQVGGGVRSPEIVQQLFKRGIHRVVIGTWALRDPDAVCALAKTHGDRIVVGLDAKGNILAGQGWTDTAGEIELLPFAKRLAAGGIVTALYTQIENDGMLTGVDVVAVQDLAQRSGLRVIASGGVAGIEDVQALAAAAASGVVGVITGKALHAGLLKLEDCIALQRP